MLQIINDILDFSKIEAGKLELERIEFGLRETVEETIEIFAARAHAKGLELACVVDSRRAGRRARRSDAAAPGAHQSGGQRHQIHRVAGEVIVRVRALDDAGICCASR